MARRSRRRYKRNPTGLDWALILGGAAAVGLTVYFIAKPPAASTAIAKA